MFFIYDVSINSIPLMISNGSVTILLGVMAWQKFHYGMKYSDEHPSLEINERPYGDKLSMDMEEV